MNKDINNIIKEVYDNFVNTDIGIYPPYCISKIDDIIYFSRIDNNIIEELEIKNICEKLSNYVVEENLSDGLLVLRKSEE